jgi:ATP-binding cassette subfamily C protein LapB
MQVYDRVIPNHSLATLAYLFLGLTFAIAIDYALKISRSALLSWHATQFVEKVENEGVSRFLRAPNGSFERCPAAVNINRYAAAAALADYHSGQARLVAIDLPFVGIALIVLTIVGGTMVLVPAVLFFVFAALAIGRARKFRTILDSRAAQDNRKYDFIAEVLAGIHTVKGMAMEPQMQRRFERLQQAVAETTMASILTGQANQTSAMLYGNISQLIVVAIGGTQVINDHLSMGALARCTMLSGQVLQPPARNRFLDGKGERRSSPRGDSAIARHTLCRASPLQVLRTSLATYSSTTSILGRRRCRRSCFGSGRSINQGRNNHRYQRQGRLRRTAVEAIQGDGTGLRPR